MSPTDYEAFLARRNAAPADATSPQTAGPVVADSASDIPDRRPSSGKSELATKLETVTEKAVGKLGEILDLPLDRTDPHFPSVLRAQNAATNTTLTTQVKVDETALRRQQLDRLPALLKLINEIEAKYVAMYPELKSPDFDGDENEP